MVLVFVTGTTAAPAASPVRYRVALRIRDLSGSDIERFKKLSSQFRILDYQDIYVAEDIDPDDKGYILKCIRGLGLHEGTAEYIDELQ